MSANDEKAFDVLAGEYVLGTLRGAERDAFERAMSSHPSLARRCDFWQEQFSALADNVPEVELDQDLWQRIDRSIGATTATSEETQLEPAAIVEAIPPRPGVRRNAYQTRDEWDQPELSDRLAAVRRRLTRWRLFGGVSALAAAALAALVFLERDTIPGLPAWLGEPEPTTVVALLRPSQDEPGWLVRSVGTATEVSISPVASPEIDPNQDFELWAVIEGRPEPVSLGLVAEREVTRVELPPPVLDQLPQGVTLAVTVEPEGGAPSPAEHGPIVLIGTLVQLPNDG